jgi:hypothetical protein
VLQQDQLVAEMNRRQASYIQREDKHRKQIEALQQELAKTRAEHDDGFLEAERQYGLAMGT